MSKGQRFRDAYSKLRMLARGVATEKGGALINAWVKSAATLLVDSEGVISSQEYAEIASVMVKAPQKCGYVPLRCIAQTWMLSAVDVEALPTAMQEIMKGLVLILHLPKVVRYYRSRMEHLIKRHGTAGLCALTACFDNIVPTAGAQSKEFERLKDEWMAKASKAKRAVPIGATNWSAVFSGIRDEEKSPCHFEDPRGVVHWAPKGKIVSDNIMRGSAVVWNPNGLRARLKDGGFGRMLDDMDPDVVFLNEVKAKPSSLSRPWEFRRALAARGYHWVAFNYSITKSAQTGNESCGNWGTAIVPELSHYPSFVV